MRILITGGGGFIGSHLGDAFLQRGDEVFALDLALRFKVQHNLTNPRFHYIQASIFDTDLLENLIMKCDLIYHLAAIVGVEHYVADPLAVLTVNVEGTIAILKLAHRYNKKVIFSSTSEIYGKNPNVPFKEDDDRVLGSTRIDRWCYSTSKAIGEHFCFAYGKMGLPIVIVRYFNVYGPRLDALDKGRVVTIFIGKLLQDKPIEVIGTGKQTRCFTYISDAIEATVRAGLESKAEGQIINIGNDTETPIIEFARLLCRIAGKDPKKYITFVKQEKIYGNLYEDIPRRVPDISRMKEILGIKKLIPLEEGLAKTWNWFAKEKDALRTQF